CGLRRPQRDRLAAEGEASLAMPLLWSVRSSRLGRRLALLGDGADERGALAQRLQHPAQVREVAGGVREAGRERGDLRGLPRAVALLELRGDLADPALEAEALRLQLEGVGVAVGERVLHAREQGGGALGADRLVDQL